MSPNSSPDPLTPTDGNRRRSKRAKPSQKERESRAQRQEGISVFEEDTIDVMDISTETASREEPLQPEELVEHQDEIISHLKRIEKQNTALLHEVKKLAQQNSELKIELLQIQQEQAQSQQRIEELEAHIRRIQEQLVERGSHSTSLQGWMSYADAIARGTRMTTLGHSAVPMAPQAEQFFCTIDFSRVEGNEDAAEPVSVRRNIEEEIRKGENKAFKCRAIVKDHRTKQYLRILCRSEAELEIVKQATSATVVEGARIIRDQLYPIKVNNARTDAVLQPNGEITERALTALSNSNNTQVAKLSWLSSRHARSQCWILKFGVSERRDSATE